MTTIDYAVRQAPARPALLKVLQTVFNAPALFLKRQIVAHQTRRELLQLSERELDDIGISRAQIETISAEMAAKVTL